MLVAPARPLAAAPSLPRPVLLPACAANTYSVAGSTTCSNCPSFSTSAANSGTCTCNDGYAATGTAASLVCTGTLIGRRTDCPGTHCASMEF